MQYRKIVSADNKSTATWNFVSGNYNNTVYKNITPLLRNIFTPSLDIAPFLCLAFSEEEPNTPASASPKKFNKNALRPTAIEREVGTALNIDQSGFARNFIYHVLFLCSSTRSSADPRVISYLLSLSINHASNHKRDPTDYEISDFAACPSHSRDNIRPST